MASGVALEADKNVKQSILVPLKGQMTSSWAISMVAPKFVFLLTPNVTVPQYRRPSWNVTPGQDLVPRVAFAHLFLGSTYRHRPASQALLPVVQL